MGGIAKIEETICSDLTLVSRVSFMHYCGHWNHSSASTSKWTAGQFLSVSPHLRHRVWICFLCNSYGSFLILPRVCSWCSRDQFRHRFPYCGPCLILRQSLYPSLLPWDGLPVGLPAEFPTGFPYPHHTPVWILLCHSRLVLAWVGLK